MRKLTKEEVLRIPELAKTMNQSEIAETLNTSSAVIWYWCDKLKKKGIDIPKHPRRSLLD
jgi:biotin operon repressor